MNAYISQGCMILAWLVWSFIFWKNLRREGIEDDRIFDLTFYTTLAVFVASRIGFVLFHMHLFVGKSPLLLAALWVEPGLLWLTGLIAGMITLVMLCHTYKIRLGLVLDSLVVSLAPSLLVTQLGFLPASLFACFSMAVLCIVIFRLSWVSAKNKWPYGLVGIWFFLCYSAIEFILEFFYSDRVYLKGLTANQWMLIGIFAESVGVLYVRGGGRKNSGQFLIDYMQFFPKDTLIEIQKHLDTEKARLSNRIAELSVQDPFRDPDRTNDNAASDTEASEESDHDRVSALVNELHYQLQEVNSALERIQNGGYGFCASCNTMIDTDRLAIYPTATLCLLCEAKKKK